jgi:hypothetical protein
MERAKTREAAARRLRRLAASARARPFAPALFVFVGSDGYWHLGGGGYNATTGASFSPSANSWGQAYCVSYSSPPLFSPQGTVTTGPGCPGPDDLYNNTCYGATAGGGITSLGSNTLSWTPNSNAGTNLAWSNAFCAMSGITYSGYTPPQTNLQPQIKYLTTFGDHILDAWIQNDASTYNMEESGNCIYAAGTTNYFDVGESCSGGSDAYSCSPTGSGGAMISASVYGGYAYRIANDTDYLCQLQGFTTNPGTAVATAQLYKSSSASEWVLNVPTGVAYASALCIPLPYITN